MPLLHFLLSATCEFFPKRNPNGLSRLNLTPELRWETAPHKRLKEVLVCNDDAWTEIRDFDRYSWQREFDTGARMALVLWMQHPDIIIVGSTSKCLVDQKAQMIKSPALLKLSAYTALKWRASATSEVRLTTLCESCCSRTSYCNCNLKWYELNQHPKVWSWMQQWMSYHITLIKKVFTRNQNEICLRRCRSLSSLESRLGLGSGDHLIVIETL